MFLNKRCVMCDKICEGKLHVSDSPKAIVAICPTCVQDSYKLQFATVFAYATIRNSNRRA